MNKNNKDERGVIGITIAVVVGVALLIGLVGGIVAVDAGTVGVVKMGGGTTGKVMQPGFNFKKPLLEDVEPITVQLLKYETAKAEYWDEKSEERDNVYYDHPIITNTSDGQRLDMTYTVSFRIDPDKAEWIVNNIGSEKGLVEQIVKGRSRPIVRQMPTGFTATQMYEEAGRAECQKRIEDRLHPDFEANGLILEAFLIRQPGFSADYLAVLEEKQVAMETVEVKKQEAEAALFERNKRIAQAEGEAKAQELLSKAASEMSVELRRLEVQAIMAEAYKISAENGQKLVPDTLTMLGESGMVPIFQVPQP